MDWSTNGWVSCTQSGSRGLYIYINDVTFLTTHSLTHSLTHLIMTPWSLFTFQVTVEFPDSACCPILDIESYPREEYRSGKCFTGLAETEWYWSRNSFFILDGNHETLMKCSKKTGSANNSMHFCTGKIKDLYNKPQIVWITLGYLCKSKIGKSLRGFKYHFKWIMLSNTTFCEPMRESLVVGSVRCRNYYKYTTFPNFYGSLSQDEALNPLSVALAFHSKPLGQRHCHKHFEYLICQAFFPHCPITGMCFIEFGRVLTHGPPVSRSPYFFVSFYPA